MEDNELVLTENEDQLIDFTDDKVSFKINRSKFYESILDEVSEEFTDLKVLQLDEDSITFEVDDEPITISLSDIKDSDIDTTLKTVALAILGSKTMVVPKLVFTIDLDDNGDGVFDIQDLVVTGVFIKEFDNVFLGYDEDLVSNSDFTVELSARYLSSLLESSGVVTYKNYDYPDTYVSNGEVLITPLDLNKNESVTSLADLKKLRLTKKKNSKMLKLKRLKDPSKYKALSKAAKLRWKKYGNRIKRGMAKYRRSSAFKKLQLARQKLGD